MEAKYTIAVPLAAFVVGCLLWRRELLYVARLRSPR
jgi:hypothetical protein